MRQTCKESNSIHSTQKRKEWVVVNVVAAVVVMVVAVALEVKMNGCR